jgi:hypothetical protein
LYCVYSRLLLCCFVLLSACLQLDTFSCFPESYKASIQGLLLAHKHLEGYAQQSSMSEGGLKPLKLTPPCSPTAAMPCSPRATLMHQGALPTSPKAPRLGVSSMHPMSPGAGCCTPRTPRAIAMAGSPAGSGDAGATSSTSISISSEASHFKATLTVSSPTRAMMQQTVNIEVFNSGVGPLASNTATTFNFGTQQLAAGPSLMATQSTLSDFAVSSSSIGCSGRSEVAGRKAAKPKSGLFK